MRQIFNLTLTPLLWAVRARSECSTGGPVIGCFYASSGPHYGAWPERASVSFARHKRHPGKYTCRVPKYPTCKSFMSLIESSVVKLQFSGLDLFALKMLDPIKSLKRIPL